ncbi:hypothetical protein SCOR_11645 [Sulfidibacter corallicola]|uniref:DUF2092 domain-containing protein n=1 Tax=Sulfidibacter corallicola TaxID=2818388 RepID=A0A8A4TGU4_SULCO|nr:hypothetical protein [Sulfidibacter corallicola]QTD48011.1 hypothetical protein J3U87_20705 [Sulfidibacter corallicola]
MNHRFWKFLAVASLFAVLNPGWAFSQSGFPATVLAAQNQSKGIALKMDKRVLKLFEKMKARYAGQPLFVAYEGKFITENNGMLVEATFASKMTVRDANHLEMTSDIQMAIQAMNVSPKILMNLVHDGREMWLDLEFPHIPNRQVVKIDLKHMRKLAELNGQLSFIPGKPGTRNPIELIVEYTDLFPFDLERVKDDKAFLKAQIPQFLWTQFGVPEPEGSGIDFSTATLVLDRKSGQIREMHIGNGEKKHFEMRFTEQQFKKKSDLPDALFQYKMPEGVVFSDLNEMFAGKSKTAPKPSKQRTLKIPSEQKSEKAPATKSEKGSDSTRSSSEKK